MKLIKKTMFFLLGLLLFSAMLTAQVTIGSRVAPNSGSLLDLKEDSNVGVNSKKGLMLPRVKLLGDNIMLESGASNPIPHTGLMVYNIGNDGCIFGGMPNGIYVWDGRKWIRSHESTTGNNAGTHIYIDPGRVDLSGTEQYFAEGTSVVLRGHAEGSGITYAWYKEGQTPPTSGSSTPTLSFSSIKPSDEGVYFCRMFDTCTPVNSLDKQIVLLVNP